MYRKLIFFLTLALSGMLSFSWAQAFPWQRGFDGRYRYKKFSGHWPKCVLIERDSWMEKCGPDDFLPYKENIDFYWDSLATYQDSLLPIPARLVLNNNFIPENWDEDSKKILGLPPKYTLWYDLEQVGKINPRMALQDSLGFYSITADNVGELFPIPRDKDGWQEFLVDSLLLFFTANIADSIWEISNTILRRKYENAPNHATKFNRVVFHEFTEMLKIDSLMKNFGKYYMKWIYEIGGDNYGFMFINLQDQKRFDVRSDCNKDSESCLVVRKIWPGLNYLGTVGVIYKVYYDRRIEIVDWQLMVYSNQAGPI